VLRRKKTYVLVVLLLSACLVSSGCLQRLIPGRHSSGEGEPTRAGKSGGVFRMVSTGDPGTLDPAYITDYRDGSISALLFNGLVRYRSDSLELVPDLARWEVSKDHKVYTFKLEKGISFSNGRELTAADVKFSFERVLSPKTKSPRRWVLAGILGAQAYSDGQASEVAGLKVKDKSTIEITLEQPYATFLSLLAMPAAYIVPKEEVEAKGLDFGRQPVGTGPYQLREWRKDEFLSFTAHAGYFASQPYLDGVDIEIITDSRSYTAQFERGELEAIPLSGLQLEAMQSNRNWQPLVSNQQDLSIFYLALNCQKAPLNNVKVRQALNYAINRENLLNIFDANRAILAKGPIPRIVAGYNAALPGYEYNPQKAKSLLAEAGLKSGWKLRLWQSRSKGILPITNQIQKDLKAVGINVEIIQGEWSELDYVLANGVADAVYLSWWGDYADAENFLYPVFHSDNFGNNGNRARYRNDMVDVAIEEAMVTASEAERLQQCANLEQIIVEDAPWVFLWHSKSYTVVQPWVKGYVLHPIYNGNKLTDVWIDPAAKPAD
jgi:oligopeptide transport system substrate-binding protein